MFLPWHPRYSSSLTHGEPRATWGYFWYYPRAQGAGWGHRSIPKRTTWWPWMWQGTVHLYQPTAGRQQGFRPGFITLDDSWFCRRHCTQLCRVPAIGYETAPEEGPRSDQAGTKCSTKLKTSGTIHLQALTQQQLSPCMKRFLSYKTLQEEPPTWKATGRNLSRTHQAASTVHGEQEANSTLIISHLHCTHNQSREGVFSSTGWPGKHDWCWKTKGLLLPSQPATSKPCSFICCYSSTLTHTQLLLRYHQPWQRSELPDSRYNCLLQTQGRQLSERVFIYTQPMLCAQQKRCRKDQERFLCSTLRQEVGWDYSATISSCLHFSQKMPTARGSTNLGWK